MTKQIDNDKLLDLLESGVPANHIAKYLGVSAPTISRRIGELQTQQGLLLKYRDVQALHLTALQAKVLEAITDDKIAEADLKDLVLCYKVLKDKELVSDGKPSEIKGLVSYLVQMEKEQLVADNRPGRDSVLLPEQTCCDDADVTFQEDLEEERLPNL